MKPQTGAINVLQRTSQYLRAGVLRNQPAWFNVVGSNPPQKIFARQPKSGKTEAVFTPITQKSQKSTGPLYKTKDHSRPSNPHKIPQLKFVEDELRQLFYEQHPWELARPKILLENTGEDNETQDWSRIKQLNSPLDGESVVQRTLYLLKNKEHTSLSEAYDHARFEFYRARIQEEIEDYVAKEENEMFGAIYKKSPIQFGVELEQKFIDKWKKEATEASSVLAAKKN